MALLATIATAPATAAAAAGVHCISVQRRRCSPSTSSVLLRGEARKRSPDARAAHDRLVSPTSSGLSLSVSSPLGPLKQEEHVTDGDGGSDGGSDYYVNLGFAIRTLREELPGVFYREPNFDIYRKDIVFKDPLNSFRGIENYKLIFRALQFSGQFFFKTLYLDIVSIWQPVDNIIMIRWTVHGIPRLPWDSCGHFDGTSEYKLDNKGKIYEHKVDNVAINSPPKFDVLAIQELFQSLGYPSSPKPTYFEILLQNTVRHVLVLKLTRVRFYLVLYMLMSWSCTVGL